jgi:hypothetical protein
MHGGGVLIALSPRVHSCKCRHDLEYFDECVWVEIPTYNSLNLLIGDHHIPPDNKPGITSYFCFLENHLDTQNFRVVLIVISTLLVLTGSMGALKLFVIIIPNSKEMPSTPLHVFLTSDNA